MVGRRARPVGPRGLGPRFGIADLACGQAAVLGLPEPEPWGLPPTNYKPAPISPTNTARTRRKFSICSFNSVAVARSLSFNASHS